MKKVAIIQSNYIPWKGYFDMIRNVDLFIFYDHVQFTKYDWRNRNYIKAPEGLRLLTVPCGRDINRKIYEVEPVTSHWQKDHWNSIIHCYRRTPHFKEFAPFFEEIYLSKIWKNLSEFNQYLIQRIATEILKANTIFEDSRKYDIQNFKEKGVFEILDKCGADIHLCGPSAKSYITDEFLASMPSKFIWMDYDNYKEYPQLFPPFEHKVSILDLIFNTGFDAVNYMKNLDLT